MRGYFYYFTAVLILGFILGGFIPPMTVHAQTPPPVVPQNIWMIGSEEPAGYCPTQMAPTGPNNTKVDWGCMDDGGLYSAPTGSLFKIIGGAAPTPTSVTMSCPNASMTSAGFVSGACTISSIK
jgi:hypothetical protein